MLCVCPFVLVIVLFTLFVLPIAHSVSSCVVVVFQLYVLLLCRHVVCLCVCVLIGVCPSYLVLCIACFLSHWCLVTRECLSFLVVYR